MEVIIDKKHALEAGDPTGRQTIISLGIFAEAVSLAAENIGLKADLKFDNDKVEVGFVKIGELKKNDVELIKQRATDRSIYKKVEITKNIKGAIQDCATDKSVRVW